MADEAIYPINPDLRDILARAKGFYDDGRAADAEKLCREILSESPDDFEALHLLALSLQKAGDLEEAVSNYASALALRPNDPVALNNFGTALSKLRRFDEAFECYDLALAARPHYAQALHNRGAARLEHGRVGDALTDFTAAITHKPDNVQTFFLRAKAYAALMRFGEAQSDLSRVIAARPDRVDALGMNGSILVQLGRHEEALASLDHALALKPNLAVALATRALALEQLGRLEESLANYDKALALQPDFAEALVNRGNTLRELGRPEEGLASYDMAIQCRPDFDGAICNRGNVLVDLLRFDEALECYARALKLAPGDAEHHFSLAVLLLRLGLEDGWRHYEWRKKKKAWRGVKITGPEWQGEPVTGKRILLYCEQGLGDSIQFVRFTRMVAARGAQVYVWGPAQLAALLQSFGPEVTVIRDGTALPEFDMQAALMSAPFALGLSPREIPAETPYLAVDTKRVAYWASRLPTDGFCVGISWQGNPDYPDDKQRSIPLAVFAALSQIDNVRLISLQKHVGLDQLAALPAGMVVETLPADFEEGPDAFLDAAAVMMSLDLIVTPDTAPAHLAGALGRPIWIALKHVPDWRWMMDRDDSVWYPTARLFRQTKPGDWDGVFASIAEELRKLACQGGLRPALTQNSVSIPISIGELIDKITILRIKRERITAPAKRANAGKELKLLESIKLRFAGHITGIDQLEAELLAVNRKRWDIEDHLRSCELRADFGDEFIALARAVYMTNDLRSAVKRRISELTNSALFEEKLQA